MKFVINLILFVCGVVLKVGRRILMHLLKYRFHKRGKGIIFDPFSRHQYENISLGDDVFIGPECAFRGGEILIGNKVMFGPEVLIIGGDHDIFTVGEYMKDRPAGKSEPVIIHDDVWIGARVTILKGVTIGEGAVVAANSVVTKSVPPYSINAGIPCKTIKLRWSVESISEHRIKLGLPPLPGEVLGQLKNLVG